jgi:hypothetical protein
LEAREALEQRRLKRWRANAPRRKGRPDKRWNKYSAQQLGALSRAGERFRQISEREGHEYGDDAAQVAAFLRSLPLKLRDQFPADIKPGTVRKLIRRGDRLRANPRGWRRAQANWPFRELFGLRYPVDEAIRRRMLVSFSPQEVARIVRDLARLEPGTAIAERRLKEFVSETVLLEHTLRAALGFEGDYDLVRIVRPAAK